jgi:hypothetical protein
MAQRRAQNSQNSALKGSRNSLQLLETLKFDGQGTIFINLIHDQALLICLNAK